jgi:ABC-type multidrug transport system fused ATPase/permease subunit
MTIKASAGKINKLLKSFHGVIATIAFMLLVAQVLSLGFTYSVGRIVNAFSTEAATAIVATWAALGLLLFVVKNYLNTKREDFEIKRFEHAIPLYLSDLTMKRLFAWSIAQHRRQHSGVSQSVIVEGESAFMQVAHMITFEVFEVVSQMALTIGLIFWMSPFIGCIVLGVTIVFSITTYALNMHIREGVLAYEKQKHVVAKSYIEAHRNAPLVLVQAQEDRERIFCTRIHAELRASGQKLWKWYCKWAGYRSLELGFAEASVAILGSYLIIRRHYAAGSMVTLFFWARDLFGKLYAIGPIVRKSYKLWPAIVAYLELLDVEPELKHDPHPLRPANIRGKIAAKHVTFWHGKEDESDPNLVDINFSINAGEKIGIVGGSGAGKTTLVGLLLRATDPNEGAIFIDDVDLRRYDVKQYRHSVGFVEQHVPILDRSLRDNILFGVDPSTVSQARLEEVARLARIDEFFGSLKEGFDTMLGDRGVRLSGGQCQRVGIARALVKDPSILIFDEATSNLDSENEALVHDAIREVSKGKTTIIIAHRLSTVRDCDRIFMLENGKLIAEGGHEKLMQISPAYGALVQRQLVN